MTSFLGYAEPTGDDGYEDTYHHTADETYAEEFADGESEQLDDYDSYEEPDAAAPVAVPDLRRIVTVQDRKSTRLNSSHIANSYAVFCLKKKKFWSSGTQSPPVK